MKRFIEGGHHEQRILFPDHLEDFVHKNSAVRAVDLFSFGFSEAVSTGRLGYHPSILLKICVYGYLNHTHTSRRLVEQTLNQLSCKAPVNLNRMT